MESFQVIFNKYGRRRIYRSKNGKALQWQRNRQNTVGYNVNGKIHYTAYLATYYYEKLQ